MALRNGIISIGHSIKSPQVLSLNRAEARTSYYRIIVISPACSLMVFFAFISPKEQNFQLLIQGFFNESHLAAHEFPSRISPSPQAMHDISLFPNKVYFSNDGNPSINTSISTKYGGLHSIFPTAVRDLFSSI